MQCPSCQLETRAETELCVHCGARLGNACPGCGHLSDLQARFCSECGTRLQASHEVPVPTPATSETRDEPPLPQAERRQLTVMFCDLVGSTDLSTRLDPEDLRHVVRAYQQTCATAIEHFDGHIAQYHGDGLLVYFGFPRVHEDSPRRAVRAGLGILAAMRSLNDRLTTEIDVALAVRIGIHTGLVVVGEVGTGGRSEQLALGETPKLAAGIQELAGPDTLVVSRETLSLAAGFFTSRDLGTHRVKGATIDLEVHQILGEGSATSRLEAAATAGLTPLVGRERELEGLLERFDRARGGDGQVVLLSGEAGIGKSRLVQALKKRAVAAGARFIELRCSPYHRQSALFPVISYFERTLELSPDEEPAAKLLKLEAMLRSLGLDLDELVPLFAPLLSIPLADDRYRPPVLSPQRLKQKTLEALVESVLLEAGRQAVLAVWEDLHWADPSTLQMLELLIERVPSARLLALLVFRPSFVPPWPSYPHRSDLALERLEGDEAGEVIRRVAGKTLPDEVVAQLVTKTDGVPLFVEELTKMVRESGLLRDAGDRYELVGPLPALAIPATLQDSLMARLDLLGTAREVAQLAAAVGREFTEPLLRAVSPLADDELRRALDRLVEAELVFHRGRGAQARYVFKHALIQDAAYQSLLRRTRQRYHRQIVCALEERFPETAALRPELLAHHATEAGLRDDAVDYWQRAGTLAAGRWANLEAISHLEKALALVAELPESRRRAQRELALYATLGAPLIAARSHSSPEVEQVYGRAWELSRQVGDSPETLRVQYGLFLYYFVRGELANAQALGEQMLELAERQDDPALLVPALVILGQNAMLLGKPAAAHAFLERGLKHYDPEHPMCLSPVPGNDLAAGLLIYSAWALWFLGYGERSRARGREAMARVRDLGNPFGVARVGGLAAILACYRRDSEAARELSQEVIAIAREQGFLTFEAVATVTLGWAHAAAGRTQESLALLPQGMAIHDKLGFGGARPFYLTLQAEAYGGAGRFADAEATLADALAWAERFGDRIWEAEIRRWQGELSLRQAGETGDATAGGATAGGATAGGATAGAEEHFRCALDVARSQGAKPLELRAAASLARLWRCRGKPKAARELLAGICGWFSEDLDSPDLEAAEALLESLSA